MQVITKMLGNINIEDNVVISVLGDSGGGGEGTTDYEELSNKPQINGVELDGNKSASDLGLLTEDSLSTKQDILTACTGVYVNQNTISVIPAMDGVALDMNKLTLGQYLSALTDAMGGIVLNP